MAQPPQAEAKPSDLGLRLLSAIVLIPPVIAAIHFGSPYFDALVIVGGLTLVYEVHSASGRRLGWTVGGAVYVVLAVIALISLRGTSAEATGALTMYWMFVLIWAADSTAYFVGRGVGGPKLAPRISPKKTWSGFCGALLGAGIIGAALAFYLEKTDIWPLTLWSAALGGVGQGGDLLESWFKRQFDRKDMSGLIPGHGGLFDRVDGLLAVAIACWIGQVALGKALLAWL
jgi:phosphatidate cytidylyltransferase